MALSHRNGWVRGIPATASAGAVQEVPKPGLSCSKQIITSEKKRNLLPNNFFIITAGQPEQLQSQVHGLISPRVM
jgi:hypothetical protein